MSILCLNVRTQDFEFDKGFAHLFIRNCTINSFEGKMLSSKYSCEASDFGHKQDDTVQNFAKTESFRPRKTSWNTVNFH